MAHMDFIGSCVLVMITGIVAILMEHTASPAMAGVAMSLVVQTFMLFPFAMCIKSELSSRLNSISRIKDYTTNLQLEPPSDEVPPGPQGWPSKGTVEFKGVTLRYRNGLPIVLDSVDLNIPDGQKLAVVGLSGKTTMVNTMLRFVDMRLGHVAIDKVDIKTLPLKTLRNGLGIIPQEPCLFQGSIRFNIDPYDEYQDDQVWSAVEKACLKDTVQQYQEGINTDTSELEDWDISKKQLVYLARAILRKPKILILDEAQGITDMDADNNMHAAIRTHFRTTTVITLAQRVQNIVNYDKIAELEKGKLIELKTPAALVKVRGTLFRDMVINAGISPQDIEQMARDQEAQQDGYGYM